MRKQQLLNEYKGFLVNLSFREKKLYEQYRGKNARQCCEEMIGFGVKALANYGYPTSSDAFVKRQQKVFQYVKDYRNPRTFNDGLLNIYMEMLKIANEFYVGG